MRSVNQLFQISMVLLWVLVSCSDLKPKAGKLVCACDADCPPHWICCENKRCYPPGPDSGDGCADSDTGSADGDTGADSDTDTDSGVDSDTVVDGGTADAGDNSVWW